MTFAKLAGAIFLTTSLGLAVAETAAVEQTWTGTWAAAQQIPEPRNALAQQDLENATLRQIVHLSVGGARLRVHVSNVFGTAPLRVSRVHVARPVSVAAAAIEAGSDRAVTFAGRTEVTIPAGAEFVSDALDYAVAPLSSLAITMYLEHAPVQQTGHPGSRATSYLVHGDQVGAADLTGAQKIDHWYQLAGVDVTGGAALTASAGGAGTIVVIGDSITDGHGVTTNGNDRWTDVLARRLQETAGLHNVAVVNAGLGGNRVLLDGLGPNALARFDRDVVAETGVRYFIVLEGINDLGTLTHTHEVSAVEHAQMVHELEAAYEQMITRAHAHGIEAIGATILPDGGSDTYHPNAESNADRHAVNDWIRAAAHFDAVIDFDKVVRDPANPDRLLLQYDSGDHLHPSPAGYAAMANAIPLNLFGAH